LEKIEMKKTLVADAAMAAITGAMADVTISGNLNQAYAKSKATGDGSTANNGVATDDITVLYPVSAASFLTFSGSEDLGSGMKASFKFEQGLNMNGSSLTSSAPGGDNREGWVGISGGFGSAKLGTQYSPYFFNVAASDPNGVNNVLGWTPLNVLVGSIQSNNAITYDLPTLVPGVAISVQKTLGGESKVDGAPTGDGTGWSIGYANGPLYAGFAASSRSALVYTADTTGTDDDGDSFVVSSGTDSRLSYYGIGALTDSYQPTGGEKLKNASTTLTYDLGVVKVGYTGLTSKLATDKITATAYSITAPMGALTLSATMSSGKQTISGTEYLKLSGSQYGAYYALSKRTTAYVMLSDLKATIQTADATLGYDVGGVIQNKVTAVGIQHSF
jgi:predicted porin